MALPCIIGHLEQVWGYNPNVESYGVAISSERGAPVLQVIVPPFMGEVHCFGDTTPCRMTGMTLHSHVRYEEI